jgi:hypothetical protein
MCPTSYERSSDFPTRAPICKSLMPARLKERTRTPAGELLVPGFAASTRSDMISGHVFGRQEPLKHQSARRSHLAGPSLVHGFDRPGPLVSVQRSPRRIRVWGLRGRLPPGCLGRTVVPGRWRHFQLDHVTSVSLGPSTGASRAARGEHDRPVGEQGVLEVVHIPNWLSHTDFDPSVLSVLLDDPAIALWANEASASYRISPLEALAVLGCALLVEEPG